MATADQIKMLIQSHFDKNDERFKTIVLQLAAYEAKKGHKAFARDIRNIIEKSQSNTSNNIVSLNKDANELIHATLSEERLSNLVVSIDIKKRIERIINEFVHQEKLKKYGLSNRRKILLAGPPGTGKTLTSKVLAGELHLPFCTIMMDKMITKYMGETSVKLRQIFETIKEVQAVYLFDEFDAIGTKRGSDNDVGEMRRVLNSFLQFLEQDDSTSLIIAATNHHQLLDQALFRRFDDVLYYKLPDDDQIKRLILNRLGTFKTKDLDLDRLVQTSIQLSHAEISKACDDALKEAILTDSQFVTTELLEEMIQERCDVYQGSED
ncbi:AAA family ATPase [Caldibacillus debilis]|jgi:SpoVK/Ycf46/Vps4 family AAA+-type ATPase|uniref:AAA+ ATPase domain-containing protein n=1 Tax=Caldibacillus debilis TaxID=301148 RepID=A0A150LA30_9BACI|nr:ATP-binding protein [Caldibacillus debilis]KYD09201.1 hypothetical protein B4135_3830 [Caldibacillus debilis]